MKLLNLGIFLLTAVITLQAQEVIGSIADSADKIELKNKFFGIYTYRGERIKGYNNLIEIYQNAGDSSKALIKDVKIARAMYAISIVFIVPAAFIAGYTSHPTDKTRGINIASWSTVGIGLGVSIVSSVIRSKTIKRYNAIIDKRRTNMSFKTIKTAPSS
jgi:hypothetical protein